jgi:hypothetical protein
MFLGFIFWPKLKKICWFALGQLRIFYPFLNLWKNEQVGDENNWYLKKCRPSVENMPTNITNILSIKNLMWLMSVFLLTKQDLHIPWPL